MLRRSLGVFCVLLLLLHTATAAYCHGKPSPDAQPNNHAIWTDAPTLVRTVTNGALYRAGGENGFNVVHLWGTPYELGVAQGTLMKEEAYDFVESVYAYIVDQIDAAVNGTSPGDLIPHWLLSDVAELGLEAALELELVATRMYTPSHFIEELRGLAHASGVDYTKLELIHLLGELTKGSCSMTQFWGDAIAQGYDLLARRSLDWTEGPFPSFAQVTVYHPTDQGHAFANVGFTGFIGSFSGISSVRTGTFEIGVSFPDASFGKESRFGIPFTYLLRDMLQFPSTMAECETLVKDAKRTCYLLLGFVDAKAEPADMARIIQYSHSVADFWTWDNYPLNNETWHPAIQDANYDGMDWLCPGYQEVLGRQINDAHGSITPEIMISNITAIEQSGNLFASVYSFEADGTTNMYQSFASANKQGPVIPAYDRQYTKLDMTTLFAMKAPSS